jgi:PAS domain S-box-containing protein
MNNEGKTNAELIIDLSNLEERCNSMKEFYEKEIAGLKDAEEKLRRSTEIFRLAFMNTPDSVNINRLSDGMYISVNEGFTNILGYSEKETVGRTSLEMNIWVDPSDRMRMVREIETNGKVKDFEAKFLSKSGKIVDGLFSASLINLDGTPHILNVVRDITVRKSAEEALEKEQFLINALMNNLTDHVYFKDLESKFIRTNRAHAHSFGLEKPEDVIGKSDLDFFADEDARKPYEDEQRIIKTGQPILKEENLKRKDGSDAWFSVIKMPLRDNKDNIIGTFGISRDITESRKTETALQESEKRLRFVTQSANDAIITADSKGKIRGWNNGAQNIFGYYESEVIGKSLDTLVPFEELVLHSHSKKPDEVRDSERVVGKTLELKGLRKNGIIFPLELSLSEWETSEGKFYTGIIRDISIRKRTELENKILFEISQGVTTSSNLDELLKLIHFSIGKVVYAENCFVALYDQKSDLFSFPYFVDKIDKTPPPLSLAKSCTSYVFRTVKPLVLTQKVFDNLVETGEMELIGTNSPSWIGIPLQSPTKVIGVLVLQHYEKENVYSENDVNFLISIGSQIAMAIERKKAEEEIALKNELLQAINAEKDRFFSIIAHDLRGPLSAFVAATQIITEEIQNMSSEEIREITNSMKTSATNIYSLLENLLEWSRLRRGGLDFIPVKMDLKKEIFASVEVLNEIALKKNITMEIIIPNGTQVVADSHMFETVVRNLVSNAIKFSLPGGIAKVESVIADDLTVEIRVTDTGIGMTPDLIGKLFRLDQKTSRPGTEGEPSTGLGLLLCKEFIEKLGGEIRVESEVGKGSTFSFSMPLVSN